MKTGLLIDIPQGETRQDRINAFKAEHAIWTGGSNKFHWDALLMPQARELVKPHGEPSNATPMELLTGFYRLLDEAELLVTGASEIEAIRELCLRNRIPCKI